MTVRWLDNTTTGTDERGMLTRDNDMKTEAKRQAENVTQKEKGQQSCIACSSPVATVPYGKGRSARCQVHLDEMRERRRTGGERRIGLVCQVCGTAINVIPARADTAKYCSRKCKHTDQLGSEPPNKGVYTSKEYSICHQRVRKLRGKPSLCEDCGTTTAKRFEWASISGNYSDMNDYKRLCVSCHHRLDGTAANLKKAQRWPKSK